MRERREKFLLLKLESVKIRLFFYGRRMRMAAMVTNETVLKDIVCLYRYSPHSPGDGYYEIQTE